MAGFTRGLVSSSRSDTSNETTPLLIPSSSSSSISEPSIPHNPDPASGLEGNDNDRPLPKFQIFLLSFARLVEPVAFFGIFPFINKMILETGGMKEEDVGFYSGLIESVFALTQMFLMIPWGRASDRIGRKPVLVFSLGGVAIATAVFGLSKTIWQMVLFRCLAGVFAGTIVTVRAMLTEVSTQKTQARAFSFFAFSGNVGIFLGPLIGGALANPTDQYPSIFGNIKFLKEFPYSLSTFAAGAVGAIATVFCGLFLKETLKRKDRSGVPSEPSMNTLALIRSPGVGTVLFLYGHVMLLGLAFTAVSPVFWFTHPTLGGYGFTPQQISFFLAAIGVSQGVWLLVAFPPLQKRYGTGTVLRGCFIAWPIMFISAPICNVLLRKGWTTTFWIVAPITQILGAGVAMAFTCVQLCLNDISPSPNTLGTLNAIGLTVTSGLRTVGPAVFTSLFALGARTQILHGYFMWVFLIALAIMGSVVVRWLPEAAEGRPSVVDKRVREGEEG